MNQIIAFIDPLKFYSLFGNLTHDQRTTLQFKNNGEYLGDNSLCFYLFGDDTCAPGLLNPDLVTRAKIILVPDEYPGYDDTRLFDLNPTNNFKVLFHSKTRNYMYSPLLVLPNCQGYHKPHNSSFSSS